MTKSVFRRFYRDTRGNTAITFGLAAIPLMSVIGMTVDYSMAARRQTEINSIADAAALSTTTPSAMSLSADTAKANAVAMFNAQVAALTSKSEVTYGSDVTITVVDTKGATATRSTNVTWKATSPNIFSSLLSMNSISIGGASAAYNSTAANIDFYILLDTSPSMAIPSSQSGIDTMVANTSKQGGCAFACHHTKTSTTDSKGNVVATGDTAGNPKDSKGNIMDNYALARKLGVSLRIDLVKSAVANLYKTAKTTQAINKAVYRVATYTFDESFQTVTNLTTNLDQAQTDATDKVDMLTVYSNSWLDSSTNNNDQDSQWDQSMAYSAYIPNPGNGTNQKDDKPQEILFIVTDGVVDEAYPGYGPVDMTNGNRTITYPTYQKDYCTTLKNRGIRIAMLYTTYYPLPTNGFYNQYVDPFQSKISGKLQACASPGLFFEVNTGGDIDAAMQALFSKAVTTAHLTK